LDCLGKIFRIMQTSRSVKGKSARYLCIHTIIDAVRLFISERLSGAYLSDQPEIRLHQSGCYSSDVLLTTKVGVTLNVALSDTSFPNVPTTYMAPS